MLSLDKLCYNRQLLHFSVLGRKLVDVITFSKEHTSRITSLGTNPETLAYHLCHWSNCNNFNKWLLDRNMPIL